MMVKLQQDIAGELGVPLELFLLGNTGNIQFTWLTLVLRYSSWNMMHWLPDEIRLLLYLKAIASAMVITRLSNLLMST